MREQLRLAELSFNVLFHQARTSAVENTNRPLRVNLSHSRLMRAIQRGTAAPGHDRTLDLRVS